MTTFRVNGEEHTLLDGTPLTYEHLVALAGLHGKPTVVLHQRIGEWTRSRSVLPGLTVIEIGEGMRFTVCHTGAA